MDKQPFVSVVVATYNSVVTLRGTIQSLLHQNYPAERYEIIVVDDGSTDQTAAFLAQMAAEKKLCFITQARRGPAAARNAGARLSRGELLAFTDHDCLPVPGWLAALAEYYAMTGQVVFGGPIENIAIGHWLHEFQAKRGIDHAANHQEHPIYLDTANIAFRKDIFLSEGGLSETIPWSEDVELGFRLRAAGYTLSTVPKALVWHMGTPSFTAYLRRSYRIGKGTSTVISLYPSHFSGPPAQGIRLAVKRGLDQLMQRALKSSPPLRVPFSLIAGSLKSLAYDLAGEQNFYCSFLPNQFKRYRGFGLGWPKAGFYLFLEWLMHIVQMIGQFTQSLRQIYQQIKYNQLPT